ncbi:hypothetical protein NQZ68_008897 [Dissostichus eleginoides]|nr:hypothetical protein NQZ68_008897 [Dissostichus eleginoides]
MKGSSGSSGNLLCRPILYLYKDVGTGYRGSGRRGMLQGFYSEEGFPGYCSWSCFLVAEGTADPASPQ